MVHLTSTAVSLLSLSGSAIAACHYGTSYFPRGPNVTINTFGYTGLNGPLNWFSLNETTNALCATGRYQSPINLNASIPTASGNSVSFNVSSYPDGAVFENLGGTLEVPSNGTLVVGNTTYKLAQFHFHTTSEHRIDLEYFPMEMHFVLESSSKSIAVVSFLIDLGRADPLLTSIFTYLEGAATPGETTLTGPLAFANLQQHLLSNPVYQYTGSLTTPPCSENVLWVISTKPLHIDQGTYDRVRGVLGFNARYTQNTLGGTNLLQNIAEQLVASS